MVKKTSELLLFAKRFNHRFLMFSKVLQCFSRFQPSLTTIFDVFLDAIIGTTFFRLFPMVAIIVAIDHRQRSFAQVYSKHQILMFNRISASVLNSHQDIL